MRQVVNAQFLIFSDLAQSQFTLIVFIHIIHDAVESTCQDLAGLAACLILKFAVFVHNIAEIRNQTRYEVVGALDDLMFIALPFLQDLHHDLRHDIAEHRKILLLVFFHIHHEKLIPQIRIVSFEIAEIHLQHHDHIVFVSALQTMHVTII